MKIVIPNFAAPDSFVDNVASTLVAMGHDVVTRPVVSNRRVNSRFNRVARQVIGHYMPNRFSEAERWLLAICKDVRPQIVLCLTQPIREEVLAETRSLGVRHRIVWWGDTPANMRHLGILNSEWDFIYIKDQHGVNKFRRLGLNASLLHEAMNPKWHRPTSHWKICDSRREESCFWRRSRLSQLHRVIRR